MTWKEFFDGNGCSSRGRLEIVISECTISYEISSHLESEIYTFVKYFCFFRRKMCVVLQLINHLKNLLNCLIECVCFFLETCFQEFVFFYKIFKFVNINMFICNINIKHAIYMISVLIIQRLKFKINFNEETEKTRKLIK